MKSSSLCIRAGLLPAIFLIAATLVAQIKPSFNADKGFFDFQNEMNAFFKKVGETKTGFKQWKRAEWYFSSRVDQQGRPYNQQQLNQEALLQVATMKTKMLNDGIAPLAVSGTWSPVGPTAVNSNEEGIGRVNRLGFVPSDPDIIFAATAGGGLWKTTNGGSSWTPLTDGLPNSNVADVAVNPANTNIIYLLTGDADASSFNGSPMTCCGFGKYSTGILKSTDGGITWRYTGYKLVESDEISDFKLLMHPSDFNTLFVVGTNGVYRTTDAGANWTRVLSQKTYDIEFMPNNPSVVYAGVLGGKFYKSINGGTDWTLEYSNPTSWATRVSIAVTPDRATAVYMLICNTPPKEDDPDFYSFNGLYFSSDSGNTWVKRASVSPNVFSGNGVPIVGRAETYAHTLAVSPFNDNVVNIGAISIFRTTNGGANLGLIDPDNGIYHVDVHELTYGLNGNTLYAATDGGVYKSTNDGATWSIISGSLAITQYYRISVSPTSSLHVMGGSQDNGTHLKNSISPVFVAPPGTGGDGTDNAFSPSTPSVLYASKNGGTMYRSINTGASFNLFCNTPTLEGLGFDVGSPWVTNISVHPTNANIVFMGYRSVIRGVLAGSVWIFTNLGANNSERVSGLKILEVAPSNASVIYAGDANYDVGEKRRLWRSDNAGSSWVKINVPDTVEPFTRLTINPGNYQEIFLAYSGYRNNTKVFKSTNGGITWSNITGSLPNVPVNCIVYSDDDRSVDDAIYVGTDIGVFYRNNTLGDWIPFNTGLPVVEVTDLKINASGGLLRAGTYGRGIWQTALFSNNCPATENFLSGSHPPSEPAFVTVTNSISSGAIIRGVGANIQYKAGNSVTLTRGFLADGASGAKFVAYLGPCPGGGLPPGYLSASPNGLSGFLVENK